MRRSPGSAGAAVGQEGLIEMEEILLCAQCYLSLLLAIRELQVVEPMRSGCHYCGNGIEGLAVFAKVQVDCLPPGRHGLPRLTARTVVVTLEPGECAVVFDRHCYEARTSDGTTKCVWCNEEKI
jgi:hypothetical protein